MKPARFDYARPESLSEALALLGQHGSDAAILSGGQSLVPMLNLRLAQPGILIDINRIPDLDAIALTPEHLVIGARARHNDVLRSSLVAEAAPLITQALGHVAHEAIRNRGTFGGSLALADPASELPACAICLDARIIAGSTAGERAIPAAGFFEGLYMTALEPGEMIVRVEIPRHGPDWRFAFDEVARRHGDFAMAGLALGLKVTGGVIAECRIVYSGVEAQPRRIAEAEAALVGAETGDKAARVTAAAALATLEPIEGGEYPPAYRIRLARTLLDRLLTRLLENHHVAG